MLAGRDAIGTDLNPLAVMLARAKTYPRKPEAIAALVAAAKEVADFADARRKAKLGATRRLPQEDVSVFAPHVLLELDGIRERHREGAARGAPRPLARLLLDPREAERQARRHLRRAAREARERGLPGAPLRPQDRGARASASPSSRRSCPRPRRARACSSTTPASSRRSTSARSTPSSPRRPTSRRTTTSRTTSSACAGSTSTSRRLAKDELGARRHYERMTPDEARASWERELAKFFRALARVTEARRARRPPHRRLGHASRPARREARGAPGRRDRRRHGGPRRHVRAGRSRLSSSTALPRPDRGGVLRQASQRSTRSCCVGSDGACRASSTRTRRASMPTVTFESSDGAIKKTVAAPDGGSLADLCDDHEAPIPFSCRSASCATCHIEVLEGAEALVAAGGRGARRARRDRLEAPEVPSRLLREAQAWAGNRASTRAKRLLRSVRTDAYAALFSAPATCKCRSKRGKVWERATSAPMQHHVDTGRSSEPARGRAGLGCVTREHRSCGRLRPATREEPRGAGHHDQRLLRADDGRGADREGSRARRVDPHRPHRHRVSRRRPRPDARRHPPAGVVRERPRLPDDALPRRLPLVLPASVDPARR